MKEFAIYIKQIRESSNLTQTQFAARIGIDSAALSKIENNKKNFDPQKLDLLSSEFNLNVEQLKAQYFGERIALDLYAFSCPLNTLEIAEEKYSYLVKGKKI